MRIRKFSAGNIRFMLLLLFMLALPFAFSTGAFAWLDDTVLDLEQPGIAVLWLILSAFLMGFGLLPTTFVALVSGYWLSWLWFPGVVAAYLCASFLGIFWGRWAGNLLKAEPAKELLVLGQRFENRQIWLFFFCRLSPVLPFAMTNIALSKFPLSWPAYLGGTLLGMLPRTLLVFSAGMAASHLGLLSAETKEPQTLPYLPYLLFAVSALGFWWLYTITKKHTNS